MDHYNPAQTPAELAYDAGSAVAEVRYVGPVSASGLEASHEALLTLIKGRPVVGLIVDVRDSTPAYSPADGLSAMEACVAEMALERVAVLAGPGRERLVMLMETVGFGQGVRVRVLEQADEAWRFASGA
jgi:hypothetical protein